MTKIKHNAQSSPSCAAPLPDRVHIVSGGHGYAFEVKRGTAFRIVDIHGHQIVDMMAWVTPYNPRGEHLSMSYSRYKLGGNIPPAIGECLVTNKQEPIFKLTADQCHTHDMTFMACNPAFYEEKGLKGHRSCATNIAEAMKPFGMESYLEATSVDPFNVFQNTPDMALKDIGCSRPGDYVEFEVLKDAVVAVSSCPYDVHGFGGGKATDVAIVNPSSAIAVPSRTQNERLLGATGADALAPGFINVEASNVIVPSARQAALSSEDYAKATKRLFWAAEHGDLEVVLLAIQKGVNVNERDLPQSKTALHWAAEKGYKKMLQLLLEERGDVKSFDKYGETPLHYAADSGHEELVSILLKHHSDPAVVDRRGRTALQCARDKRCSESVRLLLPLWQGERKDQETMDATGRTMGHWATVLGCEDVMVRLL